MYTHWMQTVQNKARKTLAQTREVMKKYYDQRATSEPDIDIGHLAMLNVRNIRTKRLTKKLSPSIKDSKSSKNEETELSKSISRHPGKSSQSFTYYCSNHTKSPIDLTQNNLYRNPKMSKATWNGRLKKS